MRFTSLELGASSARTLGAVAAYEYFPVQVTGTFEASIITLRANQCFLGHP